MSRCPRCGSPYLPRGECAAPKRRHPFHTPPPSPSKVKVYEPVMGGLVVLRTK